MAEIQPPAERLSGDGQRIAKLLARAGVASRREIERMIADGRVALNGTVIDTPATILASLDGVTVDGNPVAAAEAARLFLYHKPPGLLVTERDPGGRPTIYDRLPAGLPRVLPVGRLDLNTEGLLLLTTDGGLKRQLELPATGVERAYRARAYGPVTQAQLEELIEGVEIEGIRYGPIDANLERRTGTNVWIEMILKEGKNREVRRVLEHLGLKVSRLLRTRYGPFVLADLPVGAVAEVRAHDVDSFRKNPTRLDLPQAARRAGVTSVHEAQRADPVPGRSHPSARPSATRSPPAAPTKPRVEPDRPRTARPPRATASRNAPPRSTASGESAPRAAGRVAGPKHGRGKPAAAPAPAKAGRVRADGSVARREGPARAERARSFRDTGEPRPVPAPDTRPATRRTPSRPSKPSGPRPPRRPK